MDFKAALLSKSSRSQALHIRDIIIQQPERLAELWDLLVSGEKNLPQRVAWPIDHIAKHDPLLFEPYIEQAIELLEHPFHNSVHRSLSKVLSLLPIPEEYQGKLFDICLNKIADPAVKVAIQVHCMQTAYHIALDIPELCEELAMVIEEGMEYGSAGYTSRGKKILKAIRLNLR
jgi:hypothetical protein